jgi:hypothetical protein
MKILKHSSGTKAKGALLAALLFAPGLALAQSYSVDWSKVSGGGASSNGQYCVTGTIGQPDASGNLSGGNYTVDGGFWSLVSVVQTPGAPMLYITQANHTVTVYWQNVSGWTLQQNSNVNAPAGWSNNSNWTTSNGTNYLNITSPSGSMFFRLRHP